MSKAAIRAVLFDYGGVIVEEGFYNGLVDLAEKQSLHVNMASHCQKIAREETWTTTDFFHRGLSWQDFFLYCSDPGAGKTEPN